MKESKDCVRGT